MALLPQLWCRLPFLLARGLVCGAALRTRLQVWLQIQSGMVREDYR